MILILCATCVTSHAPWHTFYIDIDGTMKIGVLLLGNIVLLNRGIVTRQHSPTEYIGKHKIPGALLGETCLKVR